MSNRFEPTEPVVTGSGSTFAGLPDFPKLAILLGCLSAVLLSGYWSTFPHDFAALYVAAQFYEQGLFDLVYQSDGNFFWNETPEAWRNATEVIAAPYGEQIYHYAPYVYPPLWAALLAPVTAFLGFGTVAKVVLCANVAAFLGMIWLGFRLLRPANVRAVNWALFLVILIATSSISHLALNLGQPQIGVCFLILLSFCCLADNRPVQSGGWLALAAAVKLAPAMFIIIFLMERNWRALASFTLIGGVLAVLSVSVAGWPLHAAFLAKLAELDGGTMLSRINLGLEIEFYQLWLAFTGDFSWRVEEPEFIFPPRWISWIVSLSFVVGVVATFLMSRGLSPRARIWSRLILISLVLLFTSPLGWIHYLILPTMLLPGVLEYSKSHRVLLLFALLLVGYSLPLYLYFDEIWWSFIPQMMFHFLLAVLVFVGVLRMTAKMQVS